MTLITRMKRKKIRIASIKYLVKLPCVQETQKPIITSQNASYTGQAHSRLRKCKNIEIYFYQQIVRYELGPIRSR